MLAPPINFMKWIEEHRQLLKPPVCNAQVFKEGEFIVMVVGGPNQRRDYHLDPGAEFFYQLEGRMVLRVMEDGAPRDIPIEEGEIFLLPPDVPHSPQRFADTVGIVIERQRREGEQDGLRWYCDACHAVLHEARFPLTDITTQIAAAINAFKADEALRTCRQCGAVMTL
jgi:3-hydroxyanthranilate 3,4-dioxygenase